VADDPNKPWIAIGRSIAAGTRGRSHNGKNGRRTRGAPVDEGQSMSEKLLILVLDDHVDVAESLGEILELKGHRAKVVHCGPDAVEAFRKLAIDLAIFDVKMPGMNGVEAFMEIKNFRPEARIVMMSGYADDGLVARAMEEGALGLLRKPFAVEDLMTRIDEITAEPALN
jgi:two-component system response regulator HydG